jgi:hypothetical protein
MLLDDEAVAVSVYAGTVAAAGLGRALGIALAAVLAQTVGLLGGHRHSVPTSQVMDQQYDVYEPARHDTHH